MRIDSHHHFWKYDPIRYSWIDDSMAAIRKDFMPQDLAPLLRESNIDGTVVVQADQSEEETDFLLKLAAENPFIKGVVGWVDLSANNVGEKLKSYATNPLFKGVRHTVYDATGEFMLDPHFQNGIKNLTALGLTYDILAFDYQLLGAIELVRKFPNQAFVLDHMAKPSISSGPSKTWKAHMEELGKHPNVFCKLSGMVTETENFNWETADFFPFLDVVVEAFGTERLMFGSDWPVCLAAADYKEVLGITESYFAVFCEQEVGNIFGGNAQRFYNLE